MMPPNARDGADAPRGADGGRQADDGNVNPQMQHPGHHSPNRGDAARRYPVLAELPGQQVRPVSFVVVRFSGEYEHNILRSECVSSPEHQLVSIFNVGNLAHGRLGEAINAGLDQARHEIIVVAHEDVLLIRHWDRHLFACLDALYRAGIREWGVLGSAGWTGSPGCPNGEQMVGHWSDPHGYWNLLQGRPFAEADRIDEHLMVLRRSQGLRCDPDLPSIHNIGRDMPMTARQCGLSTYVIDAPTIHKYADASGRPIISRDDSPKIFEREGYAYKADRSLCDDAFAWKWSGATPPTGRAPPADAADLPQAGGPVLLVAKGGGGSRLVSLLATDAGLFIGNRLNQSGDALEMVMSVYRGVLRKYRDSGPGFDAARGAAAEPVRGPFSAALTADEIRAAALGMLRAAGGPANWGFKLPELILLLPELLGMFPEARVLHLVRDPLETCLRRTHMTGRLDNQIGRVTLPAAYRHVGRPVGRLLDDSPGLHMACTTRHQLELALDALEALPPSRLLRMSFEHLVVAPGEAVARAAAWLGTAVVGDTLARSIDSRRARTRQDLYPPDTVASMVRILEPLRERLGYEPAEKVLRDFSQA